LLRAVQLPNRNSSFPSRFLMKTSNSRCNKISLGDVPNHIVRVFEAHQIFLNNAPVINGLELVETWQAALPTLPAAQETPRHNIWATRHFGRKRAIGTFSSDGLIRARFIEAGYQRDGRFKRFGGRCDAHTGRRP
jgi:hypothetical protein